MPQIAYTMLSETLASYSVTMLGCNFRCMYCNAYRISQYPDAQWFYRDYVEPSVLADEAIARMIPGITEHQVLKIAEFIAEIDPMIPYRLIGFRPNFILYYHPGPGMALMNDLAEQCKGVGLTDVAWSGYYPTEIPGGSEIEIAAQYLRRAGCHKYPRSCGECELRDRCPACLLEPWR
jgi:pyruvate-formate lyase-activating enzyme